MVSSTKVRLLHLKNTIGDFFGTFAVWSVTVMLGLANCGSLRVCGPVNITFSLVEVF